MKYSDFNEAKLHGTADFPFEYYSVSHDNPQYVMQPHWHKEFEIIKVYSGLFRLHLNGMEYTLSRGDIILVESGTIHQGEPENCYYECLVFDLNMLRRRSNDTVNSLITPLLNGEHCINLIMPTPDSHLYQTLSALFTVAVNKDPFSQLEIYSLLFKFLSLIYKENMISTHSKNPQTAKKNQAVIKLLDWIDENYSENISLNRLSEISNLSKKYICRIFKEYTAKTPMNYINELRIDAACNEMTANKKNVTEAAIASGFNDLSYFSRLFKRYKGISPNCYKKMFIK